MEDRHSKEGNILKQKLKVINVGVEIFADELARQNVEIVRVDWQPPAGGDEELLKLLDKLGG